MKKQTIEKWSLLEQSGELSPRRCRKLAEALAQDPQAAEQRAALHQMTQMVREQALPEPSEKVMNDIRREARLEQSRQRHRRAMPGFYGLWQQAGAYTLLAILLTAATVYFARTWDAPPALQTAQSGLSPDLEWMEPIDQALSDIEMELALAENEWEDDFFTYEPESLDELNRLAMNLLEREG